ncbi:MAG: HAMP domain-containing histidine kinase [Gemmatimonadetes bacterium]|nr:HAMP domain-containing histidine kinase [Gemmatimonadota bacterium]
MNTAVVLSACVAVLHAGLGVLLLAVSRAPGWRAARVFAVIAFSAAGYSVGNISLSYASLPDAVRLAGVRFNFLMAGIFVAAWILYAFGGRSTSVRGLPRWASMLAGLCLLGGVIGVTSDLLFVPRVFTDVDVTWSGVRYRFPTHSVLGELTTYAYFAGVIATCVAFSRRRQVGGTLHLGYLVGFAIFVGATANDVLITNGDLNFLMLADLGFLSVVVPMTAETVRRFVLDARRLSEMSTHLTEEIEIRTQERDEAQHAWIEAERQAALGRLAAGVGHEINNPLTYLRLNVELMGEWGRAHDAPEELMESVESALDGADRIRRVVDALRAYSRPDTGQLVPVAPELVTQAALRVTGHQLRQSGTLETTFDAAPAVLGDESKLVQAIVTVLVHAAASLSTRTPGRPGKIVVRVGTNRAGRAEIEVADNGPGISREDLRRVTQPYFTTHASTAGAGMGLFLAHGVVQQMGGALDVESEVGAGTRVRITMPPVLHWPPSDDGHTPVRVAALTPPSTLALLPARSVALSR